MFTHKVAAPFILKTLIIIARTIPLAHFVVVAPLTCFAVRGVRASPRLSAKAVVVAEKPCFAVIVVVVVAGPSYVTLVLAAARNAPLVACGTICVASTGSRLRANGGAVAKQRINALFVVLRGITRFTLSPRSRSANSAFAMMILWTIPAACTLHFTEVFVWILRALCETRWRIVTL